MWGCAARHLPHTSLHTLLPGVDDEGTTPLMGAALGGHIGVVRDLLEAGAEVDIADGEGGVALHFCSLAGAPAPALSAARRTRTGRRHRLCLSPPAQATSR